MGVTLRFLTISLTSLWRCFGETSIQKGLWIAGIKILESQSIPIMDI